MKLALVDSCDATCSAWPSVDNAVIVDDTQLMALGEKVAVVRQVQGAVRSFVHHAERVAGLVVSADKLKVLTNDSDAEAMFREDKLLGPHLCRQARNLGVDFASGRKLGSQVRWKRIKAVLKRQPFLRRLKAAGACAGRLVLTSLVPGLTYGASVLGMPPSMLKRCRQIARSSCVSRTAGRSLSLDLALEPSRTDPAQLVFTRPIHVWSVALHDGWAPAGYLHRSLLEAVKTLSRVKNIWQAVRGPATALVATLNSLGLSVLDPVRWLTHRGEVNVASLSLVSCNFLHMKHTLVGSGTRLAHITRSSMACMTRHWSNL